MDNKMYMGLFSSMPKKPLSPSLKPTASLGHRSMPTPSQEGHGVITHGEFGKMSKKLERRVGEEKGAEMTDLLQESMSGGVLKERKLNEVIHQLERNHRDNIGKRDIDKLKDIAEPNL